MSRTTLLASLLFLAVIAIGVLPGQEEASSPSSEQPVATESADETSSETAASAASTDSSASVLNVMAVSGYRHVPVLDTHRKLVGIVSPQRVTKFLRAHVAD